MADHPEYPQESPAIKYIVDQVSKIEDASTCAAGYYKSLGKVLARLDKTDTLLNQLQGNVTDLKKIIDFEGVAQSIDNHSEVMKSTVEIGLSKNNQVVSDQLTVIFSEVRKNNKTNRDELHLIMQDVNKHIKDINQRVIPPLWKIYGYTFLALIIGVVIGKWV